MEVESPVSVRRGSKRHRVFTVRSIEASRLASTSSPRSWRNSRHGSIRSRESGSSTVSGRAKNRSTHLGSHCSRRAYDLMLEKEWERAKILFDVALARDPPDLDPSTYCNALYVLVDDNTGLGLNRERIPFYLDRCLKTAPDNPVVFYNAAFIELERGDFDAVVERLKSAASHEYRSPAEFYDDPDLVALRGHEGFEAFRAE